jgi:hypothetical protein
MRGEQLYLIKARTAVRESLQKSPHPTLKNPAKTTLYQERLRDGLF